LEKGGRCLELGKPSLPPGRCGGPTLTQCREDYDGIAEDNVVVEEGARRVMVLTVFSLSPRISSLKK
jgi:hypothetical protein